jgi:hypothetical protein
MKGKRPPTKLPRSAETLKPIPQEYDLMPCTDVDGHCWHIVAQNNLSDCEVCCRCGRTIWFTYGRGNDHGPFVQNRPLPDNPYFHPSFASTSSYHGASRRMGERLVSRAVSDPIGTNMDDSTVAKWLR